MRTLAASGASARGEGKAAGVGRGRNWLQCNPKETLSVDPKEASKLGLLFRVVSSWGKRTTPLSPH